MVNQRNSFEYQLFEKFPDFDPKWPDKIKVRWLEIFSALVRAISTREPKGTRKN